jgi:SAM-dependent methyltransferase
VNADDWNQRYDTAELVWHATPNVFLADEAATLEPGRALDLACGEGRNAVWLAEHGWSVTGVDFAEVGIDKGRRLAAERGVEVAWVVADATTWTPPAVGYDLVAVCYLQLPATARRQALAVAATATAPGGTLVVIAHDLANLDHGVGGPQSPEVLYTPADVLADLDAAGLTYRTARADTAERHIDGADRPALDVVVRVQRTEQP